MINNFTSKKNYRDSLYLRFLNKNIKSSDNLDIIRYFDGNNCFQYFDININENDISFLKKINKTSNIKFRNINKDSNLIKVLSKYFNIEITNEWNSPILEIKKDKFNDYVKSKSNDFKRLIKKNDKLSKFLKFKHTNNTELWKDILYIDQNSWKNKEGSDMFSLYNEHISCMSQIKNSNIEVAYLNNEPVGYSLLYYDNGIYYAAKWGATDKGRSYNAGIICLLNQIKRINKQKDIYVDLWGRNNKIYDRISTSSIKRVYFVIRKNGIKKGKVN